MASPANNSHFGNGGSEFSRFCLTPIQVYIFMYNKCSGTSSDLDRIEPRRRTWLSFAGSARHRLRPLCCTARRDRSGVQAVTGFWWRCGAGNNRASSRRYLAGGVHGALSRGDLRPARVSKEIEARHCHSEKGHGTCSPAVKRSREASPSEAKLT